MVDYHDYVLPNKLDRSIIEESITFFSTRKLKDLPLVDPFNNVGVYGLFYFGNSPYYRGLIERNKKIKTEKELIPIYVGKAVPVGSRTARLQISKSNSLFDRLNEHSDSIQAAKNLDLRDFKCKFVIMENFDIDLIVPLESQLIRHFTPIWNSCITGFGIHTPGKGRKDQQKSQWDTIHPGRSFVGGLQLPDNKTWNEEKIRHEIEKFSDQL